MPASAAASAWDPSAYLAYADERGRPFFDLLSRVHATAPQYVVDLGCGPGQLTATLTERWERAYVEGIDNDANMIAAAQEHTSDRLTFTRADVTTWAPERPVDVLVSNALLQWIPQHRDLFPAMVRWLRPGGWLAFQVPGNFDEPSHTLLHQLAADPRFAGATEDIQRRPVVAAATYLADLAALGCTVDAWETTYLHVLHGPDPVFRWVSATGARPVLARLNDSQREEFVAEYKQALRTAYPQQPCGTILPFRRVFVVAQRAGGERARGQADGHDMCLRE